MVIVSFIFCIMTDELFNYANWELFASEKKNFLDWISCLKNSRYFLYFWQKKIN